LRKQNAAVKPTSPAAKRRDAATNYGGSAASSLSFVFHPGGWRCR
jgi:hypothetical protein